MKRKLFFCALIVALVSCKKNSENKTITENNGNTQTQIEGNITTQNSTDIHILGNIIDLSKFRPEKVQFQYRFIDNSGGRTPGPSDSYLEAVLYFDEKTMDKIWEIDQTIDFNRSDYSKEDFNFTWLKEPISSELKASDTLKSGHPDLVFGTANGKCWYLKNKILFIKPN
ncbi:hypothetical protein [Chryseobacterium sp. Mn2064]|uniref:hypothetical protein n=1 Tax=Chryseobacterium sp. Mn2064 TaxID=3395263 RepID=UPI003BEB368F